MYTYTQTPLCDEMLQGAWYMYTCIHVPGSLPRVSPHAKNAGHWSLGTRLGYTHTDLRTRGGTSASRAKRQLVT